LHHSAGDAFGDEELDLLQEMVANLSFALQYLHKDNALRYLSYFDPLTDLPTAHCSANESRA